MVSNYISKENTIRIANGFRIIGIVLLLLVPLVQAMILPTSYWGFVTVDGIAKPDAQVIVLDSSCKEVASAKSLQDAAYQVIVEWDDPETPADEGVVEGETITFMVDGKIAASRNIDDKGTNNKVDIGVTGSSSTTCSTGYGPVEIRGEAAQGPFLWDANNFPGFFYDLRENIGTETLHVNSIAGRIIPVNAIDYSTHPQEVSFNYSNFGKYQVVGFMGNRYFAGYTENTIPPIPEPDANFSIMSTLASGQIHKVLMDDSIKRTISVNGTVALKDGYVFKAMDIDLNGRTMLLLLLKDGTEVDSSILRSGETYVYSKRVGNVEDLPLIFVRFDNVFAGTEFQAAFLKGIFQISEDFTRVKAGNKFGVMEITQVNKDKISMRNNYSMSLSRGSIVDLMGDLKIIVADNDSLRYNPIVQPTQSGKYEVRGPVFNGSTLHSWTGRTFAGLYYDLDSNGYSERLDIEEPFNASGLIGTDELTYSTKKIRENFTAFDKKGVNIRGSTGYDVVGWQGQKWVAINGSSNKLARLLFEMDPYEKKTLAPGEIWSLGSGYELKIDSINAKISPREVNFTLRKDGKIIDKATGQAPNGTTIPDKQKAVYNKALTILNETDTLLFTLYVDSVFSGSTTDLVQFRYGWLIDKDSAIEIKVGDKFGVFGVKALNTNEIKLSNEMPIILSKNAEISLLGDIKFKVSDSETLRFYPKVDFVIELTEQPPYSLSILINQGRTYTRSRDVILSISAAAANEMSFSNDGSSWSPWEAYNTTKSWRLADGDGIKTVHLKTRNDAGQSYVASDTIILDTLPLKSKIEIRGSVVNETNDPSWNAWTFAGFFYDLKYGIKTESLNISQNLSVLNNSRVIEKDLMQYWTTKVPLDFMAYQKEGVLVNGKSSYDVVGWQGEKRVAIKGAANKLANLILEMDGDDKKTLTNGETWSLGSGYELKIIAIDANSSPRQVWFTFRKEGGVNEEFVVSENNVSYVTNTIEGESNALLFTVYVDRIFQGAISDMAQFKYAWLINESNTKEIKSGDIFDKFIVKAANSNYIDARNKNEINLTGNTEQLLFGKYKLKVADSHELRFYPFVEFNEPGIYEIRGEVAFDPFSIPSWNGSNFAELYYDLDSNIRTETLSLTKPLIDYSSRIIPDDELILNITKAAVDFKVFEKEGVLVNGMRSYDVTGWRGEKYVAIKGAVNKQTKLIFEMGKDENITLSTGETSSLGQGYELIINAVDARATPRQAWLSLTKDGAVVDDFIVQAPEDNTTAEKQKAVYFKTITIAGESDALLFTIYVDQIFSGTISDMVRLKYGWLIDKDSAKEIQAGNVFETFIVREANNNYVRLTNQNPISLAKNTESLIIGKIVFKIADNKTLRFYPKIDQVITDNSKPPFSLSIKINNDDVFTNSTTVNLSLSASYAEQMSFSSDNITWSSWEPFSTTRSWMLTGDNGPKTIYFKARNSNGEADPVSDTIILDTRFIDTIPPTVIINSPANGVILNTPNIIINGTAHDKSGIKEGSIMHEFENGGSVMVWDENNSTSIEFSHNIMLHEGWNKINVIYIDAANNSGIASVNLTLVTKKPKISFESRSVDIPVNSSRLLKLMLDTAPAGLSGYNITISLSNGSKAKIISVDFPGLELHNNSSVPSDSVWIKATDLNETIKNGSSNIILARLGIRGDETGVTDMIINVRSMDDGNGARMDPDTSKVKISIIPVLPLPGSSKSPTDPDNDGLYEDINGNGRKDFNDVVKFFNYIEWMEKNEPANCFDFNGNGRIDFNDIIILFKEL